MRTILTLATLLTCLSGNIKAGNNIRPGALWPDNRGIHINAHGGGILKRGKTFYWFGEHKADTTSAAMVGVTCYSSTDLANWTYRDVALSVSNEKDNDIERGCIIERPKVVYNAKTRRYVMWFHLELKGRGYAAARYGVAVANKPEGPYQYLYSSRSCPGIWPQDWAGSLDSTTYNAGRQMKWWTPEWRELIRKGLFVQRDYAQGQMARDQTVYVDDDGKAYHIFSSEDNLTLHIAELTDDYLHHTGRYWRMAPGGQNEAPTLFKYKGVYWIITSGCTGWAPNKARMFFAKRIQGPWTQVDNPCRGPKSELTFGGQGTYILQIGTPKDPRFVFMADIWRPKQPSDARYIWLPITFEDGKPVIQWTDQWSIKP